MKCSYTDESSCQKAHMLMSIHVLYIHLCIASHPRDKKRDGRGLTVKQEDSRGECSFLPSFHHSDPQK